MSHLTAPMPSQTGHQAQKQKQKPFLYDLPRPVHPLTPPDTDYETPSNQAPAPNMSVLETEPLPPHLPLMVDSPYASPYGTLHRKKPSVTYVHSGLREARERVVHRGLKWLVVVVPPASFATEHGHLGHTLSSGPSRRLSNGLLMPLYLTLSSQLSAIAREFSFPSISGLCVYLHTNHGGLSLTPRVSDDSWPMLWGHLFDVRSPSLPIQQLPIGGQIEFDIDLPKARWYDSWLASSRRDFVDVPQSVTPSRAQSVSHWRHDSQTSFNELLDDQVDPISVGQQTTTKGRNIKKLSLLDRIDSTSVRSISRLVPRDESPPSQSGSQVALQALPPIVQGDEPLTAKKAIDSRVESWRMSASAAARSPMAATGQTSLDPVNMPNTMQDLPTASASEFELNLDDYTWSVSSVGPPDYDMESIYTWERTHSVHMDRRGEGSVCLTPSICTSFGPDDDFLPFSPASYMSRLPSPDLAWRMMEDVPLTPTTATSWGAPLEYPPSPVASSYAPSIDIAARFLSSRPVTPTTATSWGAPLSYPPSPIMLSRVPSPDIAHRVGSSAPSSPRFRRRTESHYALSVPYFDASIYHLAVPYFDASLDEPTECGETDRMARFSFPAAEKMAKRTIKDETPTTALGYPTLDIYPAVYPTFDIYPSLLTLDDRKPGTLAVSSFAAAYPIFDLYPAVYPSFNIYPALLAVESSGTEEMFTDLLVSYPAIEIYPAVYPYLTIYPAVSSTPVINHAIYERSAPVIPMLQPTTAGYPDFNIYPAVGYPWSVYDIYPQVEAPTTTSVPLPGIEVRLQTTYPTFEIYSAVYPYSLDEIYPSVVVAPSIVEHSIVAEPVALVHSSAVWVGVEQQYPVFDIYPAVGITTVSNQTQEVVVSLGVGYPTFEIYPATRPWGIYKTYPAVPERPIANENVGVVVKLAIEYPVFDIYTAVYPYSLEDIYPAVGYNPPNCAEDSMAPHADISAAYPNICPYPPVYPHFAIYPAALLEDLSAIEVTLDVQGLSVSQYPHLVIYLAVYPCIEIYPGSWAEVATQASVQRRKPKFTHVELCEQVFAAALSTPTPVPSRRKLKFTHLELRAQVVAAAQASIPTPQPASAEVFAPSPKRALPPPSGPSSARTVSPVPIPKSPAGSRSVSPILRPISPPARSVSPMRRSLSPARPPPAVLPRPVPPLPRSRPAEMSLRDDDQHHDHMNVPGIVAIEPSPVASDADPLSPVLFEMVTTPASAPATAQPPKPVSPAAPTLVRSRSRSGTVNAPPQVPPVSVASPPPGARPVSIIQPLPSESSSDPAARRSANRLSGLPAHPAVNRRVSPSGLPRPMSTFGPLPPPPQASPGPVALPPSPPRRQPTMATVREQVSPVNKRFPQLPSPLDEKQKGWRTPLPTSTYTSGKVDLSRSKTMPTRAAPRGPRGSTLISERAKAFDNPSSITDSGLKLSMSTLAEFPAPPLAPLPSAPASSPIRTPTSVSKLDRSKYPFA